MPGIEEATAAFAEEIAPARTPSRPVKEEAAGPVEKVFGGSDFIDGDDDDDDTGAATQEDQDEDDQEGGERDPDDEEGEEGEEGDEEDGDEDGEEDEEGAEEPELKLDAVVQVTVDGQPTEVTIEEAINGYIRQETFHQRMNKLHEAGQELGRRAVETDQNRVKYVELVHKLEEQLKLLAPAEPDWDALYAQDPAAARQQQKAWDTYTAEIKKLDENRAAAIQEIEAGNQARMVEFIHQEKVKIFQQNPDWQNEKVMIKDLSSMRRTAKAAGFTDKEVDELYDSRMVAVLKKASKYDRLMAKKPKPSSRPTREGGQPSRTGSPSSVSRSVPKSAMADSSRRLRKTGKVQDAVHVFKDIIRSK